MPNKRDDEFREQIRALVSEFEQKGVSIEMILDYVSSLMEDRAK